MSSNSEAARQASENPDCLAVAGIETADIILAVTPSDEVNMIVCQIAHSVFSTPIKIAYIIIKPFILGHRINNIN